jgi:simple sugar transport system permease protein
MSDAETARPPNPPRATRHRFAEAAPRLIREGSLYLGLVVIFIVGSLVSDTFLRANNQRDVLRAVSQNGILAVGMTLVIITGGIDLSVGRMLGLGSTLAAMLLVDRRWTAATWFALGAAMVSAGTLFALLARAVFVRARGGFASLVQGAAFLISAGLVAFWGARQVGSGLSVLTVLVVVPLSGLLLGGVSGLIISKCRLQPFIVTLAMMTTAFGAARLIASAGGAAYIHPLYDSEGNVPPGVDGLRVMDPNAIADVIGSWTPAGAAPLLRRETVQHALGLIPVPGLFFLACLAIGAFILNRLRFGRYIYAIGGNEETARLSGINVDRVKIAVYAVSGMLSFLAGVLACAQYGQGKPDMGQMGELDAIAAVVIGGASLMGGRGRMIGTLVGVLIFGYLTNILSLCGVSTDVQLFITGIIIVVAVLLQEGSSRRWIGR